MKTGIMHSSSNAQGGAYVSEKIIKTANGRHLSKYPPHFAVNLLSLQAERALVICKWVETQGRLKGCLIDSRVLPGNEVVHGCFGRVWRRRVCRRVVETRRPI
jgi:hypothetical protein